MSLDLLTATPEDLTLSDEILAFLWRILAGATGPLTTSEVASIGASLGRIIARDGSLNRRLRALEAYGWIDATAIRRTFGSQGHQRSVPAWVARKERDPAKTGPEPKNPRRVAMSFHERVRRSRDRLTRLAQLAHQARYSAIAADMGDALFKIEEEARAIRDSITRSQRSRPT